MPTKKFSSVSPESQRRNWDQIFNGLVQMLRTQQAQLETLVKERKILEDRIKMQNEGWISDVRLLKDQISEMKENLIMEEKKRVLEAAKADFMIGSRHKEACLFKWVLGETENELEDFKAWFQYLSHRSTDAGDSVEHHKRKKGGTNSDFKSSKKDTKGKVHFTPLENEIGRLKHEYEKLATGKNSEVSSLLAEKKFVWNQYNIMEKDFLNKLRKKNSEVEEANAKIEKLITSIKQLQSSNVEKDDIISRLKIDLVNKEAETNRWSEEISRSSVDLELLRKSESAQVTPVLSHCTTRNRPSCSGSQNSRLNKSLVTVKKGSAIICSPNPEKKGRGLKRKGDEIASTSDTPQLFSGNFKVPKLKKNPSSSVR